MAKPPGLRKRGGSWEMRVRVPERLRAAMGKGEIIKSFGGVSTREAFRLGWDERANVERQFENAEVQLGLGKAVLHPAVPSQLTEDQLDEVAKRLFRDMEASAPKVPLDKLGQQSLLEAIEDEAYNIGRSDAVEGPTIQMFADDFAKKIGLSLPHGATRFTFYEAVREAWLEHLGRQQALLRGEPVQTINPAFAGVDANHRGEGAGLTLTAAIKLYIEAPERSGNRASTLKMDRSRLGAMCDLIGGEKAVASIVRGDLRAYVEQLCKLPAHFAQRFPGMSATEAIIAGEKRNAPTLTPTSIKRDIQAARSFFGWLEKEELIDKNPAQNIEGPRAPKKSSRRPFLPEEMQDLLYATSPEKRGQRDWAYWCTRITMLHGFRFTEPLGLQVKDITKVSNIWIFRLRANEFRSLKTEETTRDVPIHPRLIELGLLTLIEGREPDDLLLVGVPQGVGTAFNAAQKQMARIIRKGVSDDPDLVFHSLRHTFRDEMRNGNFPRGIEERLGGWKIGGNSAMDGYGQGYRMEALQEWIAKITYDGLKID